MLMLPYCDSFSQPGNVINVLLLVLGSPTSSSWSLTVCRCGGGSQVGCVDYAGIKMRIAKALSIIGKFSVEIVSFH